MNSLPYPVLCPIALFGEDELRNDPDYDHQLYGRIDLDGVPGDSSRNFTFTITFQNEKIAEYIRGGKAKMSLIVEAKTSLVRRAFAIELTDEDFSQGVFQYGPINLDEHGIALPAEATIYIASVAEIRDYTLPGAPSSMGRNDGVPLPKGAILAYSMVLPLLPRVEKASSIIEIRLDKKMKQEDSPIISYTEGDKISVRLDEHTYGRFGTLKEDSGRGDLLTYSLVLPALIQAISVVRGNKEGNPDFDDAIASRGWYRSLEESIRGLEGEVTDQSHPYEVAHLVMKKHLSFADSLLKILSSEDTSELQ